MARIKKSKKVSNEEMIRKYEKARDNLLRLKNQKKRDQAEGFDSKMLRDRILEVEMELNVLIQELRKRGIQL